MNLYLHEMFPGRIALVAAAWMAATALPLLLGGCHRREQASPEGDEGLSGE